MIIEVVAQGYRWVIILPLLVVAVGFAVSAIIEPRGYNKWFYGAMTASFAIATVFSFTTLEANKTPEEAAQEVKTQLETTMKTDLNYIVVYKEKPNDYFFLFVTEDGEEYYRANKIPDNKGKFLVQKEVIEDINSYLNRGM